MASSEKAGALKNAFVNAIANDLGEEVMAEAGAMENAKLAGKLGMDVGDQAGMLFDLKRGGSMSVNDGVPKIVITDGNNMSVWHDSDAAKPLRNKEMGLAYGKALSDQEKSILSRKMYDGATVKDKLLYDNPHSKDMYPRAMKQGFTD